ncbi:MAG: hypothetical protein ACREV6_17745 [Clostridium sp.]|uniref:hypothetical protein n=1 Tax=Clostridium sp. TaxID=1506 RepID=UPI003D6D10E9
MNIKLLKQKNFVLLVLGGFVSVIGSEMQTFILSLYVLDVTGSGTKFASGKLEFPVFILYNI